MNRPKWTDFFLGLAKVVSRRSHDVHTQHGCVVVNDLNQVLALGYNGFPRGCNDESLPLNRPETDSPEDYLSSKYPWMDHSEENAIANAPGGIRDAVAYITGPACFNCLKALWRHGVRKVIHLDGYGYQADAKDRPLKEELLKQTGMNVIPVPADLSWLVDMVLEDPALRRILDERLRCISE